MSDQEQVVDAESFAIQSGRDTNITQTVVSPTQMREIMEFSASQLPAYFAVAAITANARMEAFEEKILQKFEDLEKARPEAFKDPDFQYQIRTAQHAHARSGDEGLCDMLVDLIARRSLETKRSRLSLSLNSAIDKAALLTPSEIAELSLCFFLHYAVHGAKNLGEFAHVLNSYAIPFIDQISRHDASYNYLEAQSCARIMPIGEVSLLGLLIGNYGGLLSKGFEPGFLDNILPETQSIFLTFFTGVCMNDSAKLQLTVQNRKGLESVGEKLGISSDHIKMIYSRFESTMMSQEEIIVVLTPLVPRIRELFEIWSSTPLKKMTLTSDGMAIGYVSVSAAGFDAKLADWIQ